MINQSQTLEYTRNGRPVYTVDVEGSAHITGKVIDQDEAAVNITGTFQFKLYKQGTLVTPNTAITVSKATDTTTGYYYIQIIPANIAALEEGYYDFKVLYTHVANQVNVFKGVLKVE